MMIEIIQDSLFYQLSALLLLAGLLGLVAIKLRQPLIVAFIILGIVSGPALFDFIDGSNEIIKILSELGITLLLFMVGLKLDLGLIKRLGPVSVLIGLAQVCLTALLGGLVTASLGYGLYECIIAGIALAFSSTIIVIKLLSDKRAIDSLYGKMALGILIVQDIIVIFAMVALAAIASDTGGDLYGYGAIIIKIILLIVATSLFIRFIAKPLTHYLSKTPELMMIFAIGMAAIMAAICDHIGLGKELGGLIAGVCLASTPYHNAIAARLSSLRDFLLLFFFIELGLHMELHTISSHLMPAITLSLFVLFIKPAIIMAVMILAKYRKRISFMTGITLGQLSEFSLIFMAMAITSMSISEDLVNLFTLTALISIAISCYAITYNNELHGILERYAPFLSGTKERKEEISGHTDIQNKCDIIVFGMGRYGSAMANQFQSNGLNVLGVDFDPVAVKSAENMGVSALYGDVSDPEFVTLLPLDKAKAVIFAFHHFYTGPLITDLRRSLAKILRDHGYKGRIVVTSYHPEHDRDLEDHGIDITLTPFDDAALHGAEHVLRVIKNNKGE